MLFFLNSLFLIKNERGILESWLWWADLQLDERQFEKKINSWGMITARSLTLVEIRLKQLALVNIGAEPTGQVQRGFDSGRKQFPTC